VHHDRKLDGHVVVHPDRGSQYVAMRCTERLADARAAPLVGSVGDAYDHVLAETIIGLYETDVIRRRGPWRSFDDVEDATLEWVAWLNLQRLVAPLGYLPPAAFKEHYDRAQAAQTKYSGIN
jgi:transposase InsO family protein